MLRFLTSVPSFFWHLFFDPLVLVLDSWLATISVFVGPLSLWALRWQGRLHSAVPRLFPGRV